MTGTVLPQRATPARADVVSVDWLFEPDWPGSRVMAWLADGDVTLTGARGEPVEESTAPGAATILVAGLSARSALVEAVWTTLLETSRGPAIVVTDLVELDGDRLDGVPFAERRRLLAAIVVEGERLRVSPIVKHPVARWLESWRASGFTHYRAHHQNAPYLPGEANPECLEIAVGPAAATPGLVARLTGSRERPRRIGD